MTFAESSDDKEDDDDSRDWFLVTDENIFDDVWNRKESQVLDVKNKVSVDCADPAVDPENVAMEINNGPTPSCQVELYNSGMMCHISPYCKHFENLIDIPNKSFTTTNHQKFVMTRVSDMIVELLNGYDISHLCLTEVLFLLDVRYTLVSIGHLDKLGLSIMFAEGFYNIRGSDRKTIGQISHTSKGLYHIVHKHETANAAEETIMVMELHHQYGHIIPSIAHQLVKNLSKMG